jgi:hypothetical protein
VLRGVQPSVGRFREPVRPWVCGLIQEEGMHVATPLYDQDFYAWPQSQAALTRQGKQF